MPSPITTQSRARMVHLIDRRSAAGRRPFAVERRALAPRAKPYSGAEVRVAGIAAVRAELFPRPLLADVERLLAGRSTFPEVLFARAAR